MADARLVCLIRCRPALGLRSRGGSMRPVVVDAVCLGPQLCLSFRGELREACVLPGKPTICYNVEHLL